MCKSLKFENQTHIKSLGRKLQQPFHVVSLGRGHSVYFMTENIDNYLNEFSSLYSTIVVYSTH